MLTRLRSRMCVCLLAAHLVISTAVACLLFSRTARKQCCHLRPRAFLHAGASLSRHCRGQSCIPRRVFLGSTACTFRAHCEQVHVRACVSPWLLVPAGNDAGVVEIGQDHYLSRLRGGSGDPEETRAQAECDWATGVHGLPPPISSVAASKFDDPWNHEHDNEGFWRGMNWNRASPMIRECEVSSALTSFSASYNEVPAARPDATFEEKASRLGKARSRLKVDVAQVLHGRKVGWRSVRGFAGGRKREYSSESVEVDVRGKGGRERGNDRGPHKTGADGTGDEHCAVSLDDGEWEKRVVGEPRIIGNGTFGVVYAVQLEGGETVAVKRVLQDPRYRNRELAIMKQLRHPNIVSLIHYYHTKTSENKRGDVDDSALTSHRAADVYLYLVMEYLPSTLHRSVLSAARLGRIMPLISTKIISWQVLRALWHMHRQNICHRDLKPQNILMDPQTMVTKLCDMGSAKRLHAGGTSIAYICSRLYRSPELIMGATEYTTAIDMWSFGCILAEMLLSRPLFPADDSPRQMQSIARIIGAPDQSAIEGMRVMGSHRALHAAREFSSHVEGWEILRKHKTPLEAADLLSQLLVYKPQRRLSAMACLAHPFFDSLREIEASEVGSWHGNTRVPPLFDFTIEEIEEARAASLLDSILPPHQLALLPSSAEDSSLTPVTSVTTPARERSPASSAQRESEGERS